MIFVLFYGVRLELDSCSLKKKRKNIALLSGVVSRMYFCLLRGDKMVLFSSFSKVPSIIFVVQ